MTSFTNRFFAFTVLTLACFHFIACSPFRSVDFQETPPNSVADIPPVDVSPTIPNPPLPPDQCKPVTGCVGLAWDPSQQLDPVTGKMVPVPNVGYKIHWGNTAGDYPQSVDVGAETTTQLKDLPSGIYYFVASAYYLNDPAQKSGYSNEVSTTVTFGPTIAPAEKPMETTIPIVDSVDSVYDFSAAQPLVVEIRRP